MSLFFRPRVSLPALSTQRPPLKAPTAPVRNASSSSSSSSSSRSAIDPKLETIRRTLYPPNVRNKPTPTGAWRPNALRALRKAIPSIQAHEIIERAFKLYIRHQRQRREVELARKFEAMRCAMGELDRVDARLAYEANRQEDPRVRTEVEVEVAGLKEKKKNLRGAVERMAVEGRRLRGLFPREMRIPTDTPSKEGWNYDWRPSGVKSA